MTFEAGAWIAGCLGALTGAAASWLNSTRLTGTDGWIDRAMWAIAGAFLAVLAYSVLSLLEGWAAFFQRAASPVIPLLLTVVMLAAWVTAVWQRRPRKPSKGRVAESAATSTSSTPAE